MAPIAGAPVLIVGAGPAGRVLALGLATRGTKFRLISDASGPGEHPRTTGCMPARSNSFANTASPTLSSRPASRPIAFMCARPRKDGTGHEITRVSLADIGGGIRPYPFLLTYPQDNHERFLIDLVQESGGAVEWQTKLTGFSQDADGVRATLAHKDGTTEERRCAYIAGCDGAHSQVSRSLSIDFPGGTYERLFFVADVKFMMDSSATPAISCGRTATWHSPPRKMRAISWGRMRRAFGLKFKA